METANIDVTANTPENETPSTNQEITAVTTAIDKTTNLNGKPFYKSKTILMGILGLILILLNIFGYAIPQQLYWITGFLGIVFLRLGQNVPISN